jgi:replicative DNA helicase
MATEIEEAVLGACMLEKGALQSVHHLLDDSAFYKPENQIIWRALVAIAKRGDTPDLLLVNQHLRTTGELELIGGTYVLAQLTGKVASSANIQFHARILQQTKAQRETIRVGYEMAARGYDTGKDGLETLAWAQGQLMDLTRGIFKKDATSFSHAWTKTAEVLNKPRATGVLPGFRELDRLAGHFEPGDMTILAARPGMGKTVLGLDLAMNVAKSGGRTAFFSLEMPEEQLMMRIMSRETGLSLSAIRDRSLDFDSWGKILDIQVPDLQLWIDDTAQITPMELAGKVASLKARSGLDLVVVDYLQIMKGNGERYVNREAEISSISRDLKAIAKQQKVHVLALAQINREADKRSKPEPKLSDLRESGSIEQDADNVWFIYRPEYYAEESGNTDTIPIGSSGVNVPLKGHATIICDKFRNGSKFRAYMRADLDKMRFFDGPEGYGREQLLFTAENFPDVLGDPGQGSWSNDDIRPQDNTPF